LIVQTTKVIVDVRPGEFLNISGPSRIELVHKSGQRVRLNIFAALDVVVSKISADDVGLRTKHGLLEAG
jgi:adenine deaminase